MSSDLKQTPFGMSASALEIRIGQLAYKYYIIKLTALQSADGRCWSVQQLLRRAVDYQSRSLCYWPQSDLQSCILGSNKIKCQMAQCYPVVNCMAQGSWHSVLCTMQGPSQDEEAKNAKHFF